MRAENQRSEIRMESNRDEADKCLELALKFIREGNKEKAEKFVSKAEAQASLVQRTFLDNFSRPKGKSENKRC